MNLKRDDDWLLIRAWLVAAMVADIPRPVILFHGAQGSAKSTAASMLRALVDPSACDNIDLGRDPSALAQALDHHSVPFFDNLSAITKWQADLLCKAVTGGGFMKRELYSDSEDILMAFRRAIILTGVNVPTHQPDLLDRTILVELERVSSDKRLRDRDIWERFESERPKILGALLDELVGALREHKHVQLDKLPRMADYAVLGAAASEANGTGKDAFMAALAANSERQTAEVIESDPLGAAIIALMKNRDEWSGSNVSELMKAIDPGDPKPEGWPKGARSAACRLRLLQSALFDVGLRVTFERGGKNRTRTVSIRKFASFASFASADSVNPCFNRGPMADAKRTQRTQKCVHPRQRK
ncbi:MAG: hypothetical protein M3Q32_00630 [Pseudomonadota bacterium]|nr:hypothetical protein [Pseudomonadota bacterium]